MAAVRGRDSRAEMKVRRGLFALGLRFRVNDSAVYGRPDIVFRTEQVAVFIDGDFWHGNAWRIRGFESFEAQFQRWKRPAFWRKKILRNVERDHEVAALLKKGGWRVVRFWESDVEREADAVVRKIAAVVARRRARLA